MEREEYLLSNENLKFPTFYGSTLNEYFKNEKMTKEILLKTIHDTLEYLQSMIDLLTDMIRNNKNNFATISLYYDLNIYDYVIIFKLIKELTLVIENKLNKIQEKIQCKTFEDFFNDKHNQYNKILLIASTCVLISGILFLYVLIQDKNIQTEIAFN